MMEAIVAIEDNRLWQHGALDSRALARVVTDLKHKTIQRRFHP